MANARQLKLGFILQGAGAGGEDWRHPDAHPGASVDFRYYRQQAQIAEAGKFDFLFVADNVFITPQSSPHQLNRFEPITILSALATVTEHIGLVGTVSVTYSEPYTIARQFASLDKLSGGRAGWNVVTSYLEGSASNYGKARHPEQQVRYKIASEYLDVVQGLWDSWEDDAFTYDKASGKFFDPRKLHILGHNGTYFSVKGPLNIARSSQGQPVIFQAGASEDGIKFAASRADAIFAHHGNIDDAKTYYRKVKERAAEAGRRPETVFVLPSIQTVIGRTAQKADAKFQELVGLVTIENALRMLGGPYNNHDFSVYPVDGPFPDVDDIGARGQQSTTLQIAKEARDEKLTLREVAIRFSTPRNVFVGTPAQVADSFQIWLDEGAADGFVMIESLPGQLAVFVETVVPILQERGIFRHDYEGTTFRESLGIAVPENRHALARLRDVTPG
jgi:FMN-dependent oxidoreductase (nitrilotriacetate monooxygenase family)